MISEGLYHKIAKGKCILFLGAGASISSGGISVKELSKYIYNEIDCSEVNYSDDLERYSLRLIKKGYRKELEKIVKDRFLKLKPTKEFKHITSVPWRAIYTTNYDDLIEKSYKDETYYECIIDNVYNPKYIFSDSEIPLYKLHGCINSSEKLVITKADISENKEQKEKLIDR